MLAPSLNGKRREYSPMMKRLQTKSRPPPSAPPSAPPSTPSSTKPSILSSAPSSTQPSTKPSILSSAQPSIKPSTQASAQAMRPPREQPPREQPEQSSTPEQRKYTPEQLAFKQSLRAVGPQSIIKYLHEHVRFVKNNPQPEAGVTAEQTVILSTSAATNLLTLAITGMNLILYEWPRKMVELVKEITEEVKKNDAVATPKGLPTNRLLKRGMTKIGGMTGTMTGTMTGGMKIKIKKYNKTLFYTAYIPGALTLLIFFYLVLVMWWAIIQRILNIINKYIGTNLKLPSIILKKKTAQTIYSIFFVITICFLMLYLFIDYFRNVGPELDIVQIFKQLIGASYLLWPMAILIIGSGIAKAFYKMSCNGNKPNVVSWAKIVESSALYVLGMSVIFTVISLFKPVKFIYEKFPELVKDRFNFVFVMVSVTLKLMVIYILLRMITIMIENIISSKIIFFLSKLNNDIEPPPVDCNAEEEEKKKKQSEIGRILEEIYMYISGIIMYIILLFFIVIKCPHFWMGSTSKINDTIGAVWLQLTDISTRFIVENSYGKNSAGKKKGFFSFPKMSFRKGAEVPPSDGIDNSGLIGDKDSFKNATETFKPSSNQFVNQANNTSNDGKLGELGKILTQPAPNTPDGPDDGSAGEEFLNGLRQQASTSTPPQGRNSAVQPDLMRSQGLTKPNRPTLPEAFSGEAGRVSGETSYPSGVTYDPRDTPKKIYGKGDPVDTTAEYGREGYSEAFFGIPEAQQSQLPSKKQTFLARFRNKKNQTLAQQPATPPAIPGNGGEEKI